MPINKKSFLSRIKQGVAGIAKPKYPNVYKMSPEKFRAYSDKQAAKELRAIGKKFGVPKKAVERAIKKSVGTEKGKYGRLFKKAPKAPAKAAATGAKAATALKVGTAAGLGAAAAAGAAGAYAIGKSYKGLKKDIKAQVKSAEGLRQMTSKLIAKAKKEKDPKKKARLLRQARRNIN